MQYTAVVDAPEGEDFYDISIVGAGTTPFRFEPEDPESLVAELRRGMVDSYAQTGANHGEEGYHWSPTNGQIGFICREKQIIWTVAKYGDGRGGSVSFQTPYDESFTKMLKHLPAQVDAAIARRNSTG